MRSNKTPINKSNSRTRNKQSAAKQATTNGDTAEGRISSAWQIIKRPFSWVRTRKRWQRRLIYTCISLLVLLMAHLALEGRWRPHPSPVYGASFSVKYAEELGLDWQETLQALIHDMGIKNYRLKSYWDTIEKEQGIYEFTDLDWQMDEIADSNGTVSLSIGLRQPRWPECHPPDWYYDLSAEQKETALREFLTVVVERYKNHPALISYQLENEAMNNWFGACTDDDIDQARLDRAFNHVKSLDPNTPVWMSLSDQHGLPLNDPVPDKYGYSIYRVVWNNQTPGFEGYITYPTPVWYHRARMAFINHYQNREVFIHELQLEPWAPEATINVSIAEQDKSMDLDQMSENVDFARKVGVPIIYTWGGEWWYWRKTVHDDPSIWEQARSLLSDGLDKIVLTNTE